MIVKACLATGKPGAASRRLAVAVAGTVTFLMLGSVSPLAAQVQAGRAAGNPTILRPGDNYIGWVAEDLSVRALRAQVPEIVSVQAWDPRARRLYDPPRLTAGTGLLIKVDAPAPVSWWRPTEPRRGLVRLKQGLNLVAWAGDQVPISQATLGIGDSLTRAWAPGGSRYVKRGGALWVEVTRPVNWLQPTGRLPGLHFPGGASAALMSEVRRDLADVVEYSATEFGVEVDFAAADIYVASDVESYIEYRGLQGDDADGARGTWFSAVAWASMGEVVVVKQESWARGQGRDDAGSEEPLSSVAGRYVLAHEYFHLLQHQLGDGIEAPAWMIEGSATWFESVLLQRDDQVPNEEVLAEPEFTTDLDGAPALQSLEFGGAHGFEYTLGEVALRMLVSDSDLAAPIEFWRVLLPVPVGPFGRWLPNSSWQNAFPDAFDLTANQFYEDFQRWRDGAGLRSQRVRLLGPDGEPLAGFEAFLYVTVRGESFARPVTRETSGDGWAILPVNSDVVDYVVGAEIGDCSVYVGRETGLVYGQHTARQFGVGRDAAEDLVIRLPEDSCTWRASGRVTDAAGDGLGGLRVDLIGGGVDAYAETRADGSFVITAPKAGQYVLGVQRDDCWLYYGSSGPQPLEQNATPLDLSGSDALGVDLQFGHGYCSLRINGRITDARGRAIAADYITAESDPLFASTVVSDDGSFSLTLPSAGDYTLTVGYEGCVVYYRRGSVTPYFRRAENVKVPDSGVDGLVVRFKSNLCVHRIEGVLLDFDGSPVTTTQVLVTDADGYFGHGLTDGGGRFSIRVPESGAYHLSTYAGPCTAYWSRRGPVGGEVDAHSIRVSNDDVTGIEFQLPADPASLC